MALAFSGCTSLLMLALPLLALHVLETIVPAASLGSLLLLTAIATGALLARALLEAIRDRILGRAALWLDHVVGQHVLGAGLSASRPPAVLRADLDAIACLRNFLSGPFVAPLLETPWAPIFLAVLALLNPILGLIGLAAVAGLALLGLLLRLATHRLQKETDGAARHSAAWWGRIADLQPSLGAHGLVAGATAGWERANRAHVASAHALGKRAGLARAGTRAIRLAAEIAMLAAGALLVMRGELAPGGLLAAMLLTASLLSPLERTASAGTTAAAALAAWRHLRRAAANAGTVRTMPAVTPSAVRLALTDVGYRYSSRRDPAIAGIDLTLEAGEAVVVTGPQGCGKSTLLALAAGALVPDRGEVAIDGTAIGYAADAPHLIEGSVAENIARFGAASTGEIAAAARAAGVGGVLAALPEGWDTQAGPGGESLSPRERRAVSLARAFYGEPRLIVIDDPEAGLDDDGIETLIATLAERKGDGAALLIASRDARFLALADRELALESAHARRFISHAVQPWLAGEPRGSDPAPSARLH